MLDAHLLQQRRPDAYQFHDLLRDYARHTVAATDPAAQREAATDRLLDYHLHVAVLAGAHLSTQIWKVEPPAGPGGPFPRSPTPPARWTGWTPRRPTCPPPSGSPTNPGATAMPQPCARS
jgi:hypothetical protein